MSEMQGLGLGTPIYATFPPELLVSAFFVSSSFETTYYLPLSLGVPPLACSMSLGDAGAVYGLFLRRLGSWGFWLFRHSGSSSFWPASVPRGHTACSRLPPTHPLYIVSCSSNEANEALAAKRLPKSARNAYVNSNHNNKPANKRKTNALVGSAPSTQLRPIPMISYHSGPISYLIDHWAPSCGLALIAQLSRGNLSTRWRSSTRSYPGPYPTLSHYDVASLESCCTSVERLPTSRSRSHRNRYWFVSPSISIESG